MSMRCAPAISISKLIRIKVKQFHVGVDVDANVNVDVTVKVDVTEKIHANDTCK